MKWLVFPDEATCNTLITKINTKFGWRTGQRTITYAKPTRHKDYPSDQRVAIPVSDRVADQLTAQQASRLVDILQLETDGWFRDEVPAGIPQVMTASQPVVQAPQSFVQRNKWRIVTAVTGAAAAGAALWHYLG